MRKTIMKHIYTLILALMCAQANAAGPLLTDSLDVNPNDIANLSVNPPTVKQKKIKKEKPIEFFIAGAPTYSETTSLMITGCASGEYRWNRADTTIEKSNFTLYASASINGILTLGIMGKNFLKDDWARLNFDLYVQKTKARTWGVGYAEGNIDKDETNYKRLQLKFEPEFIIRCLPNFYAGLTVNLERNSIWDLDRINPNWIKAMEHDKTHGEEWKSLELLDKNGNLQHAELFDQSMNAFGFGYTLNYDNRDFIRNASKGINVRWSQMFYPNCFVSSKMKYADKLPTDINNLAKVSGFWVSDLTFNFYQKLWKGCIMALDIHGRYVAGDAVPFLMLAEVGGNTRMRGYFQGRYRDNGIIEGQLELRQHIYGRSGIVVWGGLANIFSSFKNMKGSNTLGNYGIGYRFRLKPRINLRADIGFTNKDVGIVFGINEAF